MRNTNEMEIRFDGKSANEGFARVAVAPLMTPLKPTGGGGGGVRDHESAGCREFSGGGRVSGGGVGSGVGVPSSKNSPARVS